MATGRSTRAVSRRSDPIEAQRVAMSLEAGTVWVNQHLEFGPSVPFGGAKQSGLGLEFGEEGLREFTQFQVLNVAKG